MLSLLAFVGAWSSVALPPLHVEGSRLVDPQGHTVTLKGTNLGNWQVIEFWMLGLADRPGTPGDQYELEALLTKRFGEKEKDRLMDVYRSSWMTERDFANIRSFGFNLVRLPMNYRLMEDDREPFHLKKDAWKWIDRAVELSERNGMYVILDMHGAQGGQSPYDHTGHSGQDHLKDSPQDQRRLAWLWGELAKRYRNRSAVVAYDVMNEPYGMPKPAQVSVFKQAYAEIRKNDPEKLVFAHGNYDGFEHYGDPKAQGWHNVGFQMHYYPGLFGGGDPTIKTHAKHIESLKGVASRVKALKVPFIVGEMNVVFDSAGGADMMRRMYDLHAGYGWMTTMWSYKAVSAEGGIEPAIWGMVTNAGPMRTVDFRNDPESKIEAYFQGFATEPLVVHEKLRKALSDPSYVPAPMPEAPARRKTAPQGFLDGWDQADLGGAMPGGLQKLPDGGFELYGAGADVWGASDEARFLHRTIEGDFQLEVTIDGVEDVESYTKAGLMVRGSLAKDAPMAILTTFPNGKVQGAHRDAASADAQGSSEFPGKLPLRMRLVRQGGELRMSYRNGDGDWKSLPSLADRLPRRVLAGVLASSHDPEGLVKVTYRDLTLRKL